jgi:hypothetical protein
VADSEARAARSTDRSCAVDEAKDEANDDDDEDDEKEEEDDKEDDEDDDADNAECEWVCERRRASAAGDWCDGLDRGDGWKGCCAALERSQ